MIDNTNEIETNNKSRDAFIICLIGLVGALLILIGSADELLASAFALIVSEIPCLIILVVDLIKYLRNK